MRAYAKVNLSLDVTGKLENGYHTLRSVMQAVDLFDEVTTRARPLDAPGNPPAPRITLRMIPEGVVSAGEDNLAHKAAACMAARYTNGAARTLRDIDITIRKRIPIAAGLAGGSTDAAVVILALAGLWKLDADLMELCEMSVEIGADVPFCLVANAKNNAEAAGLYADASAATSTALAEGIGDVLTPLPSPPGAVMLVKPGISLSTPLVYRVYDKAPEKAGRPDTEGFLAELRKGARGSGASAIAQPAMATYFVNALEYAALSESAETARMLSELKRELPGVAVFLSGTGPTMVAYFPEATEAEAALPLVQKLFSAGSAEGAEVFLARILGRGDA